MTTHETLLRLMNLPPSKFDGVCRTSDGHYIAQLKGDLGYNAFLGKPSPPHPGPGRNLMLKVWNGLTPSEKDDVLALAQRPVDGLPILLHADFGIPQGEIQIPPLITTKVRELNPDAWK